MPASGKAIVTKVSLAQVAQSPAYMVAPVLSLMQFSLVRAQFDLGSDLESAMAVEARHRRPMMTASGNIFAQGVMDYFDWCWCWRFLSVFDGFLDLDGSLVTKSFNSFLILSFSRVKMLPKHLDTDVSWRSLRNDMRIAPGCSDRCE